MYTHEIIGSIESFESLKKKVTSIPPYEWKIWLERKEFFDQKDSDTILLYNLAEKNNPVFNRSLSNVKYLRLFEKELEECYNKIHTVYPNGEPKRVMLVSLPAGSAVKPHTDLGYHLEKSHRIHLPLVTNRDVEFVVNGVTIDMQEGVLVEINNNTTHWVNNNSTDERIHLIIDWGDKNDPFYGE
jgi:hypothetical protein